MIVRRLINTGLVTLLLISFSFVSFQVNAQDKGLNITGSIKEGWKGLEGTKLTLTKNGSVDETFITTSNGKFEFFFEVNASYMLDVSKSGYVGKKIEFNTDVPDDFMLVLEFDFIVELFQDQSGLNKAIFSNPVAKIQYSKRHNEFDYDLDYTMEFQKQEEEVFRELEKLNEEKYLEEEQLRKDAEKLAKGQAKEILAAQKSEATAEKARLVEEQKQRKVAEAESSRIAQEALAEAKAEREAEEARIAEEERTKKEAEVALAKQEEEKKTVAT
ncbi:MAG: flagellar biosynthesis GTPase FlhF, partial [Bacteroidia bacterium]